MAEFYVIYFLFVEEFYRYLCCYLSSLPKFRDKNQIRCELLARPSFTALIKLFTFNKSQNARMELPEKI